MRSGTRRIAALVAATAGAFAGTAQAATWSQPVTVGPGAGAQVGIDAQGRAVAAWTTDLGSPTERVMAARGANGRFGPGAAVGPPGELLEKLAVNARGEAAVLLAVGGDCGGCTTTLELAVSRPGGQFGSPKVVARRAPHNAAGLAVDGRGDAVVVWEIGGPPPSGSGGIEAAVRHVRGGLGFQRLSPFGGEPAVAANARGDAVASWMEPASRDLTRPVASFRSGGRRFGAAHAIAPAGQRVGPTVAMDDSGDTVVGWTDEPGASVPSRGFFAEANYRPAHGRFGRFERIRGITPTGFGLHVAMGADGTAAVFEQLGDLRAAFRTRRARFDPAEEVGGNRSAGSVGIDGHGAAIGLFNGLPESPVFARTRPHGGSFGAAQTVDGEPADGFGPAIAVNARGQAVGAWDTGTSSPAAVASFREP